MKKALALATYLESHAKRVYASGPEAEVAAAKVILKHIRNGDLDDGFTIRDVMRPHWTRLTDRDAAGAGLVLLEDHHWIHGELVKTGGRPSIIYAINPAAKI